MASCPNNRTSVQYRVYYAACACNVNVPLSSLGEPLGPEKRREGRTVPPRAWLRIEDGTWCSPQGWSTWPGAQNSRGDCGGMGGTYQSREGHREREKRGISGSIHSPLSSCSSKSTEELPFQNLGDRRMKNSRQNTGAHRDWFQREAVLFPHQQTPAHRTLTVPRVPPATHSGPSPGRPPVGEAAGGGGQPCPPPQAPGSLTPPRGTYTSVLLREEIWAVVRAFLLGAKRRRRRSGPGVGGRGGARPAAGAGGGGGWW